MRNESNSKPTGESVEQDSRHSSLDLKNHIEIAKAAANYYEENMFKSDYPHCPQSFIDGAKWASRSQKEKERELVEALGKLSNKMTDHIFFAKHRNHTEQLKAIKVEIESIINTHTPKEKQ